MPKPRMDQLVLEIAWRPDDNTFLVRFHVPEFCDMDSSDYLLGLKRPTLHGLKTLISENSQTPFQGYIIDEVFEVDDLAAGIACGKAFVKKQGLPLFEPLATLDFRSQGGGIQHLSWAGHERQRGEKPRSNDLASTNGKIDWKAEALRYREEFQRVITRFIDEHPGEQVKLVEVHAIEHVTMQINGRGPNDGSDHFPTRIVTPDIEAANRRLGSAEHHATLNKALAQLLKTAKLKTNLARTVKTRLVTR